MCGVSYKVEILFQLCFLFYSYPYTYKNYNFCPSNSLPIFAFPSAAGEVKTGFTSELSRLVFLWWWQIRDNILEVKLRPRRLTWSWWKYVLYFELISRGGDSFGFSDWSPAVEICLVFRTDLLLWRYVWFFGLISCGGDMFGFSDWSPAVEIRLVFRTDLLLWRYVWFFGLIFCGGDTFGFSDWSPVVEIRLVFQNKSPVTEICSILWPLSPLVEIGLLFLAHLLRRREVCYFNHLSPLDEIRLLF